VLSTVDQWFVPDARETVDKDLQVRAALKCVTPYVLERVLLCGGLQESSLVTRAQRIGWRAKQWVRSF
jgi:hypothetical protein